MAKVKIPYLVSMPRAGGVTRYYWRPSPRLRKLGWRDIDLGTDQGEAIKLAMQANERLAAWRAGDDASQAGPKVQPLHRVTVGQAISIYRQSPAFTDLRDSTRRNYESHLRHIETWAMDGNLLLANIDESMIRDLRDAFRTGPTTHAGPAVLRTLRLLLNWCMKERKWIATNPSLAVPISAPPPRQIVLLAPEVDAAEQAAHALDMADAALAIRLAFITVQRQADIRHLNRMAWREIEHVDAPDRAVLANARGEVWGFRLQQQKTRVWVDCPIPPALHDAITSRLAANQHLFPHPFDPTKAITEKALQRACRAAMDQAGLKHAQFRDLRRSGMMHYKDCDAPMACITALSGHAVLGERSILDTYMPRNSRAAAKAVATALRAAATRAARQSEG